MKIVHPSFEILEYTRNLTKIIERGIRTAYKSEDKICEGSDVAIIDKIKTFKHESTLEHGAITVKFITDRGVTHELVRHRHASYTQESTRYCNYGKGKFGNEITVIEPFFWDNDGVMRPIWVNACEYAEKQYLALLKNGSSAQEARSVLPNSLKTEIIMTTNARDWRHLLELRTHRDAHPQIRQIMCPLLASFRVKWPVLFDDVGNTDHPAPADEILNENLMDIGE
jgi:thymidylate synthase (FAD)